MRPSESLALATYTPTFGKNLYCSTCTSNEVAVTDVEAAGKIVRLIEALDEHDDTKEVYSNDKISEEVLAQIEDK